MSLDAEGEGTVSLPVRAQNGTIAHIVMPALHCPAARHNLVSTSGTLEAGWLTTLKTEGSMMKNSNDDRVIDVSYEKGKRLWRLDFGDPELAAATMLTKGDIWHLRCAHLNSAAICRGSQHARGMTPMKESDFNKCHDCML